MDSQAEEATPEDSTNLDTGEQPAEAGQDAPVAPGSFVQCPRCLMQRCFAFSFCTQVRESMQKQRGES